MDSNINTITVICSITSATILHIYNPKPPKCTVAVALDKSKVFDTVNIHKLLHRPTLTNIIVKYIANYIKTTSTVLKFKQINTR